MNPVDLVFLDRQTAGNQALAREVLQLFARQAENDLSLLGEEVGSGRREIAHRLVGAARSIGANAVADAAAAIERGAGDIDSLTVQVRDAVRFIEEHLRQG